MDASETAAAFGVESETREGEAVVVSRGNLTDGSTGHTNQYDRGNESHIAPDGQAGSPRGLSRAWEEAEDDDEQPEPVPKRRRY